MSLSKPVCRPVKGTAWDSRSLCLTQPQSPLVYTARVMGTSFLALELWAGSSDMGLGPFVLGGGSGGAVKARYS